MPDLIVIFGPPAAGKAAIGHLLAERLGYRFFHNHLTADPVVPHFERCIERCLRGARC
jgi:deoxyadenosine/deoxycytidine kinase